MEINVGPSDGLCFHQPNSRTAVENWGCTVLFSGSCYMNRMNYFEDELLSKMNYSAFLWCRCKEKLIFSVLEHGRKEQLCVGRLHGDRCVEMRRSHGWFLSASLINCTKC